ncbi:MAG: phosphatidate cytidylyltransferase [archaeon]|nr:phosphatidate cytidylyltransferase [archaeon]MCP8314699.1 phosphatidate cytidylyltransferase [archaeon]MCP8317382.1 phosphatidate cytidylyltransferase [archaeon]MCP8319618.1 phosphatidate cytidylyltransferase [archaeon]
MSRLKQINLFRLSIHLSGFFIPFIAIIIGLFYTFLIITIVTILYCISEYLRIRNHGLPIIRTITFLASKDREARKFILAPVYFALGILIALTAFKSSVGFASIEIVALGDSSARLFGKLIGQTRLPFNKMKTFEGSFFCFIFSWLGASLFLPSSIAILGALIGSIVESLPLPIDDDLTMPIASGFAMQIAFLF